MADGDGAGGTSRVVVVLGVNGQLGSDLKQAFHGDKLVGLTHQDLDITDAHAVREAIERVRPDAVINTAALTNTGACEEAPSKAFDVNALGALHLARACEAVDCLLVHVSTDYVFDGTQRSPYVESDPIAPLSVYGVSKVAGELNVSAYCSKHYIVRTGGLYGEVPCRGKGDNFVTKMLSLARDQAEITVVDDEIATPTWTRSLSEQIHLLCHSDRVPFGIVHASDEGECSWFEFATEIFRLTSTTTGLKPVSVASLPPSVPRPRYSVLANGALNSVDANLMRPWKASLAEYLKVSRAAFNIQRDEYEKWPPMW